MYEHNQEDHSARPVGNRPDPTGEASAPTPEVASTWPGLTESGAAEPPADRAASDSAEVTRRPLERGLAVWLLVLLVFGVGGLLAGLPELAVLVAGGGLFVAAQAADLEPRWKGLYYSLAWVVPASGVAAALLIIGQILANENLTEPLRLAMVGLALGSAGASLLTLFRPFSNGLAAGLFRTVSPSHTLRLAARITLMVMTLSAPGWFAFRTAFDELLDNTAPLFDRASLAGQLIGYVTLAAASVGFLLRRDLRGTLRRLGLAPLTRGHVGIAVLGVLGLYGLNAGADWLQQRYFHDLWESDHQMNETLAAGLSLGKVVLLGLSAGIGEEITMRGALQPRLGFVMTSLVFALLHVQYSWFGMVVIFLLGLGLGAIRARTSTSVAITVHFVYDVAAIFST